MYKSGADIIYSASDLVGFLECEHLTTLSLADLESPLPREADDEESALLRDKGLVHERRYVESLKAAGLSFQDLSAVMPLKLRLEATLAAMKAGVDVIYQGALRSGALMGYPDFLRRVARPSRWGDYGYEVLDTKLARSEKTKFIVQLAAYSACLAEAQHVDPAFMHIVLGDLESHAYRYADFGRYVAHLRRQFEQRLVKPDVSTYPHPCEHCSLCAFQTLCEQKRIADDHLCQVAGISRIQTGKLQAAGVTTLAALGSLNSATRIPRINDETLARLHHQARLQLEARTTGQRKVELLAPGDPARGFGGLPRPHPGDLFFDMEGNPHEEGGLEYLFGLYLFDDGKPVFKTFWAHSRAEEKTAFEQFMDFVTARLKEFPNAHIYHYAHYEPTALQRLMSIHGTREAELDNLLRRRKLVDLYKVVRESIRVSEPGYSIKNIEHFYLEKRITEVTNAGASIVFYEKWKETGDAKFLEDIANYNLDDVRSTYGLREWLLTLRPRDAVWANDPDVNTDETPAPGQLTEAEQRLVPYRNALFDPLPEDRAGWNAEQHLCELTYFLLDYHRREAKPAYWKMFARDEMTLEELIEDVEALGGLQKTGQPVADKRSLIWSFSYPEQETKLRTGSKAKVIGTAEQLEVRDLDSTRRVVQLRRGSKKDPLPDFISLGPEPPINNEIIRQALFRFADSIIAGDGKFPACRALLRRDAPSVTGVNVGDPLLVAGSGSAAEIADLIARLSNSYLFVQGPPGAGKTFTGSHAIVELMRRGFRVGVTSNSHNAINNLLRAVEDVATAEELKFSGVKKVTSGSQELNGKQIAETDDNEAIEQGNYQLVAGTAWLFSRPALHQRFDFLFIDEAGQVSLANTIAMGTSARNLVLLGDQMQLGQPTQGVHPGNSGDSTLDYLLQGKATISPERGVFLASTWRMHPDVCQFISEAVYDGRLQSEASTRERVLVLNAGCDPALKPAGISFIEAEHDGCSQSSAEEAERVRQLVEQLLGQQYKKSTGSVQAMSLENILVVAPYNMQVERLKSVLPDGARVGTVDKFQGQEAEVVIVSMTTSSREYLPRFLDFLFSKNRLNVAVSRARVLTIVIANSKLLTIPCRTPDDMALVNTLCWLHDYALQHGERKEPWDSKT